MTTDAPKRPARPATQLIHAGRDHKLTLGGVNPVVQRASTVLLDKAEDLFRPGVWTYGIHGTATHTALIEALCLLEDAKHCSLVSSGLLACTIPILALAKPGGHVLVCDNVYGPTRRFCDRTLNRWNCETEYFSPDIGADIKDLIRENTCLIFLESPGSLTFEISDTPAIAKIAKAAGIPTVLDNTWGAGVYHKPLDLGVDISVQATSKYVSGAADLVGGCILTNDPKIAASVHETATDLGLSVAPDEAYLILRGLRTLYARLPHHEASGMKVSRWLEAHPQVQRVLHPALESDPYHELWKRDFSGAGGLFGVVLNPGPPKAVHACLNALKLFGLGFSWGGFESLAIHCDPQLHRAKDAQGFGGPLLRFSVGLENPDDLIADLEAALDAYATAL